MERLSAGFTDAVRLRIGDVQGAGGAFAGFTFPRYRALLEDGRQGRIALGAWWDEQPIGFAFAIWEPESPQVRLLSLMVEPGHRRCGIGARLLARCEALAAATGRQRIGAYFSSLPPGAAPFRATLAAAGWTPPEVLEIRCRGRAGNLAAAVAGWPAMRSRLGAEGDIAFVPWPTRSPGEVAAVEALAADPECPPGLAPAAWAAQMEAQASFAMLQAGRVVGWILARLDPPEDAVPFAPPTLFVLSAYIRRPLWRSGLLVHAYHFILRWHADRFGKDAPVRFSTSADYPGMLALTRRRFGPAALWVDDWLYAMKPLQP